MEIWALIFYITALAICIIPTIFCYKKFSKGGEGSCSNAFSSFIAINFAPSLGGSGGVIVDSFTTLVIVAWIIGIIIGIGVALINWITLKKREPKKCHDDLAFNHSTGITVAYAFLYFVMYGTLILLIEDDEDFSFFELAYRKHAYIYYIVELVYFTGFFFSASSVYFVLKYDLKKYILILIMTVQSLLYGINIVIILDFRIAVIAILVIGSLTEIGYGFYLWKTYYSDEEPIVPDETIKLNDFSEPTQNV
jgi:hypothetical protein